MTRENTYLEFNNPIHIVWRSGEADDPFIERLDIAKVVNQRVSLLEIPDEFHRVRIAGMTEINYKRFIEHTIASDEYYVDYTNGFVYFHRSQEAKTITIAYKGRGFLLYPSSRIVHFDGTNPSQTLEQLIESVDIRIEELLNENQNISEYLEKVVVAINTTNEATDRANLAAHEANKATELVENAYYTTVMIYQPFVQTESDIATTYPHPKVGWSVQVYDTGIRYRWNGQDWVPIDSLGGNIPLASAVLDGLMTKEHFVKLDKITDNVDKRVVVFVIPQDIYSGVQDPHITFPFDGEIVSIEGTVSQSGSAHSHILLEKSSNMINWVNLTPTPIKFEQGEHFDNGQYTINNPIIDKGDIFRLNIPVTSDIKNLTIQIEIALLQ